MKFLIIFISLLSSHAFAGNIGGLTPYSTSSYKCQLITSSGDKSVLTMTLKEYFKPGSTLSNWAQLKMSLSLPMDLHKIESDPVGTFPSKLPSISKNTIVLLADSILTAGDSREAAIEKLFSSDVLPIRFLLSTYLGNTWEEPVVRFQKISKEQVSFSIETLERHSSSYEKTLDVNGNCEIVQI